MEIFIKTKVLKQKLPIIIAINTVVLVFLLLFVCYTFFSKSDSVYYVDNVKLFDGFRMTKEMKKEGEKQFNSKKATLDSLYLEIQREDLSGQTKEILMQEFVAKREEFDSFNKVFAQEESNKIWTRINSYTQQFSKDKNYKLIIGSSNQGDVLYADKSIDVTAELLQYVNKKYEGL